MKILTLSVRYWICRKPYQGSTRPPIPDQIPASAIGAILRTIADTMDGPAFTERVGDFGVRLSWQVASRVFQVLWSRMSDEQRGTTLREVFREGKAIGWLTHVLRGEIFAHGHFGDRPTSPHSWLLTDGEFREALSTMLRRYREMPPQNLMKVPDLLNLLYAWKQGSGTDEARDWVSARISTDEDLLTFLSSVRSWAASSTIGIYYPLKRRDLEPFLDFDAALRRVDVIARDTAAPVEQRRLAADLRNAFVQGDSS
jgi:hypothetical protein